METENVVVVTHGSWLTTLMRHFYTNQDTFRLVNFDPAKALVTPKNTGVTRLTIEPLQPGTGDKRVINFLDVNNTAHLELDNSMDMEMELYFRERLVALSNR